MLLARAGHRVLMVDRGQYGTDTISTHALMRGAVVQLHRWNILPAVIAADTTPVRQATFFYGTEDAPVSVPVKPRDGIEALYAPRRYVLDRLMVDAAVASGAEVAYGVRVHPHGLQRSATGRVTGVVLEDESGAVHQIAANIVVGADGMRSTVARLVDAQTYRVGQHATATLYGHWSGLDVAGYEWYFAPGLSAGAIPTNGGEVCVSLTVPGTEFKRLFAHQMDAAFHALLFQVAPGLAEQVDRAGRLPLQGFAGHAGFFRQSYGPGWALVGDAGYFKDPLTAHGITDALRDAELLADAIDAGSAEAFVEYQEQRDEASLEFFQTTDAIASFRWNLRELRVLHETMAKAMSREVKQLVGA